MGKFLLQSYGPGIGEQLSFPDTPWIRGEIR